MTKFDDIFMFYWPVGFDLFLDRGEHNPLIVSVVEGVACDLLALRGDSAVVVAEGVAVRMGVEVCFCVFVHDGDHVVVVDVAGLTGHWIVGESCLEVRGHEIVSWAGTSEDGKVQPEPEEVDEEGKDYQRKESCSEMATEFSLGSQSHTCGEIQ